MRTTDAGKVILGLCSGGSGCPKFKCLHDCNNLEFCSSMCKIARLRGERIVLIYEVGRNRDIFVLPSVTVIGLLWSRCSLGLFSPQNAQIYAKILRLYPSSVTTICHIGMPCILPGLYGLFIIAICGLSVDILTGVALLLMWMRGRGYSPH